MLKLWNAIASAWNCFCGRLAPDTVDEGIAEPKQPVLVLVDRGELERLRQSFAEFGDFKAEARGKIDDKDRRIEWLERQLTQAADILETERTRAANAERLAAAAEDTLTTERRTHEATREQNRAFLRTLKSQGTELAELRQGMNSVTAICKAHQGRAHAAPEERHL